jgi:hypothetical protein
MNQPEWIKLEQSSPEFFDEISHGIILWEAGRGISPLKNA